MTRIPAPPSFVHIKKNPNFISNDPYNHLMRNHRHSCYMWKLFTTVLIILFGTLPTNHTHGQNIAPTGNLNRLLQQLYNAPTDTAHVSALLQLSNWYLTRAGDDHSADLRIGAAAGSNSTAMLIVSTNTSGSVNVMAS